MFSPRTDLALEASALAMEKCGKDISGLEQSEYVTDDVKVTTVRITNEEGERIVGKARGNYITIEFCINNLYNDSASEKIRNVFTKELTELIKKHKHRVVFVVGLGNRFITPDSLGPGVSDSIDVSRHLQKENTSLCAVSPGVLGITGIETGEIIEGITGKIKPDVIIAIDALASKSMERICTTIQIADTGITPGAGVGNKRRELSYRTLGIPVIAVGVPTVVDAATVANDSVELILNELGKNTEFSGSVLCDDNRYAFIKKILNPYFGELIVTPSEIDTVIERVASIIAGGINDAGHNLSEK